MKRSGLPTSDPGKPPAEFSTFGPPTFALDDRPVHADTKIF